MKATWVLKGDVREVCLNKRSKHWERKGGKTIQQNYIKLLFFQKGSMQRNEKAKMEFWKGRQKKKMKKKKKKKNNNKMNKKNKKKGRILKKGLLGEQERKKTLKLQDLGSFPLQKKLVKKGRVLNTFFHVQTNSAFFGRYSFLCDLQPFLCKSCVLL